MKTPADIASSVMNDNYGQGTDWAQPNQFGESGFTLAQVETDIDSEQIQGLIEAGIEADRVQLRQALGSHLAVPGFRTFPLAPVDELISAYEAFDGDVDTFVTAWNNYTAGLDFPCPRNPAGLHQVAHGSCDLCGDKNRG